MQSIILPNHTAFLVETSEGNYFLGIPNEENQTLEIIVEEQYQIDNLNALINLSYNNTNFFVIPILPNIAFEMLEKQDGNMYREVFIRISKSVQHALSSLQTTDKKIEKPYQITTKMEPFTNYVKEQFKILEQIQKIKEDRFNMQEILDAIPKASEELLAYKKEKERLLALRGQLLRKTSFDSMDEAETGTMKGKQKTLSTKEGKLYSSLDPNGFINIFLLCIITLYVTVGTMLAVIFTLR